MKLIIKNGRVIDPANNIDGKYDIVIEKGLIQSVTPSGKSSDDGSAKVIDAQDCIVAPGFLDMHVHFPGTRFRVQGNHRVRMRILPPPEASPPSP